jgi:tyrosinase
MTISRRKFLSGIASVGAASNLFEFEGRQAFAQNPLTRFNAASSQGQTMLEKYARAVAKMNDRAVIPEADPKSWLFQWYSHAVPKPKNAELIRVYGNASSPRRALAAAMWDNCQAHHRPGMPPQDNRMFLPWHRMYVSYFERIVRKVLQDATFTLPYWDYTTPANSALPEQFRKPNDSLYKALYRKNRNKAVGGMADVNAGQRLDQNLPPELGLLSPAVLSNPTYEDVGAAQGFCSSLDGGLHSNVHGLIGDDSNMGDVPTAAGDPIFWLHHANIDRVWASWNAAGRANPAGTWLTTTFPFSDENGLRVDAKVSDIVNTEAIPGGSYRYDSLLPVPAAPAVAIADLVTPSPAVIASQRRPGSTPLRATVQIPLLRTGVATAAAVGGARKTYLVLRDLQAHGPPNVLFKVFLDGPTSSSPTPVGVINFFGIGGHGQDHGSSGEHRFYSFDITNSPALAGEDLKVRIVPTGSPKAAAQPSVGSVSLVIQ